MTTTTSVENIFTKNSQLANHPQLAAMVSEYAEALAAGYDPDPALLTEIFSVLCEVLVDDPSLAEEIDLLELAIIEEVLVRDLDLASNPAILGMLEVYVTALQNGYEPTSETQMLVFDALSGIETTDPEMSGLIDAIAAVNQRPATFGSVLNGLAAGDWMGFSVSEAGDVNGDGIDDVVVGARYANGGTGETYVVYGTLGGLSATLDLSALDGTNGFAISGLSGGDQAGYSVSSAGDVNGDGFDDVIIGATGVDGSAGAGYVVYGSASGHSGNFDLSGLDGLNGFALTGINPVDLAGFSVSSAGDLNDDGFDDIIISANRADVNGFQSGSSYVVFGAAVGTSEPLDLATLNGTNGFVVNGFEFQDFSGTSVSGAGDVNGDGINDIIIGTSGGDPNNNSSAGESYVLFGTGAGFAANVDPGSFDGTNGFVINGVNADDWSGWSVSSAGDVNGDGIDDVIVGARYGNTDAGESYVIFGAIDGYGGTLDLAGLDGTNGFALSGIASGDQAGYSVSSAGDVNGDGFDDVIIGASGAGPNGAGSGQAYLVFGSTSGHDGNLALSALDGTNGYTFNGAETFDFSGGSVSGAGDVNGDGYDDLLIGASGGDPNGLSSGESYLIYGGGGILEAFDMADGMADGVVELSHSTDAFIF